MGWLSSAWSAVRGRLSGGASARTFSESGPIDALLFGAWGDAFSNDTPVSRDAAMSVSAVERGRNVICSIATLPLRNYRGLEVVPRPFLDQPDPDVPRVVMYAQTVEDLMCESIAWWEITAVDYRGFPTSARRRDPRSVSINPPGKTASPAPLPSGQDPRGATLYVDGRPVSGRWMIRFDSANRPLLTTAARDVRRALLLNRMAAMYADNPMPLEEFTDNDDPTVAKYDDAEVEMFLAKWKSQRKRGGAAYVPAALKRGDVQAPKPQELQLVQLQQQVALELALHMGLDPEEVGVNTTSRTYFNAQDRRTDKVNSTYAMFMRALTDRLSMPDVTPRGQAVQFDLTDYLKPDPAGQAAYWQTMVTIGAMSVNEVRAAAGLDGPAPAKPKPAALPAPDPSAIPDAGDNSRPRFVPSVLGRPLALPTAAAVFDDPRPPAMTFSMADFGRSAPAKVDAQARTITGLAVPYGAVARKYGIGFRFRPGALEYDGEQLNRLRVKADHDRYIGVHKAVEETAAGPVVTLSVLGGPEGSPDRMFRDQILSDAAGGLYDGLSIGVDFSMDPEVGDTVWSAEEQVFDVVRATWNETSVTPDPAFTGARVTKVAASRTGGNMPCQHCNQPHPPGMACATFAQLQPPTATPPAAPAAQPQQFSVPAGYALVPYAQPSGPAPAPAPEPAPTPAPAPDGQTFAQPVNPLAQAMPGAAHPFGGLEVNEPEPYRIAFDKTGQAILGRGSHDFSTDFVLALRDRDETAMKRVLDFMATHMTAQFNVATGNVDELNPTRQRPDMYVDQREYKYPMWNAVNKGSLQDITPFVFPKFSSASGLVAAHTEGTEPSTGSFVTTGQTVTPTAYSGKARINREVWDQGGNPQTSTLIWNQMVRGVNEALEAAVVTLLNAGSYTALNTFTAGNADRQVAGNLLGDQLEAGIAALQFARGGYAFSDAFGQADLYQTLAATKASDGRSRYPMHGPANTNGSTDARFSSMDIGGQIFYPAWALAAAGQTAATKSYLIDRQSVHGWATPPQRLTLDGIAVAYVDLGVWGYQATAVSDDTGVRTISWDPVA